MPGLPHDRWTGSLEELATQANLLLPDILPSDAEHRGRRVDDVNPRLIRHYTTQGLLDPPLKDGREARYGLRHLLQLLALRRLMASGYSAQALSELLPGKTDAELLPLLDGGARLEVHSDAQLQDRRIPGVVAVPHLPSRPASLPASPPVSTNPALEYLKGLTPSTAAAPSPGQLPKPGGSEPYTRLTLLPGIELHVAGSARLPRSVAEQGRLVQLIQDALDILQRRKP